MADPDTVKPRELHVAARVADALVYTAGLAGVIAGGLLFRDGQPWFALVAWVLTFVAGAGLRLAAWAARALAELLVRTDRLQAGLDALAGSRDVPGDEGRGRTPDPYRRWGGGWH